MAVLSNRSTMSLPWDGMVSLLLFNVQRTVLPVPIALKSMGRRFSRTTPQGKVSLVPAISFKLSFDVKRDPPEVCDAMLSSLDRQSVD